MIRIDEHTVELTEQEIEIRDHFELLLDRGLGISDSLIDTYESFPEYNFDTDFWEWLAN